MVFYDDFLISREFTQKTDHIIRICLNLFYEIYYGLFFLRFRRFMSLGAIILAAPPR